MQLTSRYKPSPFARTLAVLALLFVAGLQVHEFGHSHGIDEQVADCLLCKGSADTAPAIAAEPVAPLQGSRAIIAAVPVSTPTAPAALFQARGPPRYS